MDMALNMVVMTRGRLFSHSSESHVIGVGIWLIFVGACQLDIYHLYM